MPAVIIPLPRTADGRDLLREAVAASPSLGEYLATTFDWDGSAREIRRIGLAPEPPPRREAR